MNLSQSYMQTLDELSSDESDFNIHDVLANIENRYGLQSIAYLSQNLLDASPKSREFVTTYSKDWVTQYHSMDYWRIDPVLQEAIRSILPIDWLTFDHTMPQLKRFFGEAAEFGVGRNGISIPIRGLYGTRALLSISLNARPSQWQETSAQLRRDFQMLGYYLHMHISKRSTGKTDRIKLAPREAECLKWAAHGKTAQEIAIILSLRPKTIQFYQELARVKLDAVNLTQAVFKAQTLELLS